MEKISNIPVLQKTVLKKVKVEEVATSCCTPKSDTTSCCTPSKTMEENNGACCVQPEDGSVCCDK